MKTKRYSMKTIIIYNNIEVHAFPICVRSKNMIVVATHPCICKMPKYILLYCKSH